MTDKNFHMRFDKAIGNIRVKSGGGGSPRWVTIEAPGSLSMEEVRDLHYALSRLLDTFA